MLSPKVWYGLKVYAHHCIELNVLFYKHLVIWTVEPRTPSIEIHNFTRFDMVIIAIK